MVSMNGLDKHEVEKKGNGNSTPPAPSPRSCLDSDVYNHGDDGGVEEGE